MDLTDDDLDILQIRSKYEYTDDFVIENSNEYYEKYLFIWNKLNVKFGFNILYGNSAEQLYQTCDVKIMEVIC